MNDTTRTTKLNHLSRAAATAAAALLLAAPLAASAQSNDGMAPSQDQTNAITALTNRYFDDVHYARIKDLSKIVAPDFTVTYPNGSSVDLSRLIARADSRSLQEDNYSRQTNVDSMMMNGDAIVEKVSNDDSSMVQRGEQQPQQSETSKRTLIWVKGMDGNWMLASERINQESGENYAGDTPAGGSAAHGG